MTPEEICQKLQSAGIEVTYHDTKPDPFLLCTLQSYKQAALTLRDDPDLAFQSLMSLTGLEWPDYFEVASQLISYQKEHRVTIKVRCGKDDPSVPTLSDVWTIAEWHEREAYDLVGMTFAGHQDLRRILLPEDWEGHPLRKDYSPQERWHDISLTSEPPKTTHE
ncbi:NADH-quinone oxidoreductase subunit C [bacterium]|nr:NADH-quinone oxidoreductase subunit C [bacterium]MBU1652240.1 NADH-quinone oxidoreductase subunit C [bacterium]